MEADLDVVALRLEADAFGVQPDRNAFALENVPDRVGNILVLARDQTRAFFNHGHLGAETAEHLCEFEPDIAAADHYEVARHLIERDHVGVVEHLDIVDAGHIGSRGPAADIDEDLRRREHVAADLDRVRAGEPGMAADDGQFSMPVSQLSRPERASSVTLAERACTCFMSIEIPPPIETP